MFNESVYMFNKHDINSEPYCDNFRYDWETLMKCQHMSDHDEHILHTWDDFSFWYKEVSKWNSEYTMIALSLCSLV